MKALLISLALLCCGVTFSQQSYTVNGETLSLYSEAKGTIELLWNSIDGSYRYFIKKDDAITELKNSRTDGKFQEEYKSTMSMYIGPERAKNLKLTKPDLIAAVDYYNAASDPSYQSRDVSVQLKARLGGFAGISNYPYFINPDNSTLFQLGAEFEVIDEVKLKRHSLVLQLRQLIGSSDYDFNSTQLMLNYRFKFINKEAFAIYINTKIAGYNYISQDIDVVENNGDIVNISGSGGEFQAPFTLGLGADIALGKGYLTLQYQDAVALNLDDNGEFPMDISIGYKFNL